MSILDDAIREHLELKRAHGADDAELKKLEDEAFGPPQRPDEVDPFAEAPTEFLRSPGEGAADVPEIADEHTRSGRRPNLTDLQEAPPPDADAAPGPSPADPAAMPPPAEETAPEDTFEAPFNLEDETSPAPLAPPPSPADAADVPLPPPPGGAPAADLAPPTGEEPAAEAEPAPVPPTDEELPRPASATDEPTAAEHAIVPDAEVEPGPDTEERHLIADQPTQMFDVQAEMDAEAPPAPAAQPSPSDEELVDAAQEEPQAAPPAPEDAGPQAELPEQEPLDTRGPDAEVAGHPPAEDDPEEGSAEFDFFNEQRLSDELDQALEAPLPPTDEHLAMPRYEDVPASQGSIFDFESEAGSESQPEPEAYEEDPSREVLRRADEAEAAEEPVEDDGPEAEGENEYDPETGHEDVLEDTPRFLEDAPEDDDLWFEQKPPKDFDLD
jgi:hypothetical protein